MVNQNQARVIVRKKELESWDTTGKANFVRIPSILLLQWRTAASNIDGALPPPGSF